MTYPTVNRSHLVPRMYLRNFSTEGRIEMHLTSGGEPRVVGLRDAAVEKAFYRRTRPDGSKIDDVEWSLSTLEDRVAPLLREVEKRWPLPFDDKACLAEFIALQYARGRAWRSAYQALLEQRLRDWRSDDHGLSRAPTEDEVTMVTENLSSDSETLVRMLSQLPNPSSIFGSMRWFLVRFAGPVLALSDEPIICWPMSGESLIETPARHKLGLLWTLEVAVAMSPTCALLMTWEDQSDQRAPIRGRRHHAATLNAIGIAQAEKQWFPRPGTRPRIGAGRRVPLSAELCPSYSASVAHASGRRQQVDKLVQPRIGETLGTDARFVTVA